MKAPIIGVQSYSIRQAFLFEDPLGTLKKVREMGYDAIEVHDVMSRFEAAQLADWLKEAELKCCGMAVSWHEQPDFDKVMRYNEELGNKLMVISSAIPSELRRRDKLKAIIARLNELNDIARAEGFTMGYHAHYTDFFMVDGVSSWDRIMQGTDETFCMQIDTGNMLSAGAYAVHYLNKYPHRSPSVHLKPFDIRIHSGSTMIGEDSFDWPKLIDACIDVGGADTMVIEYSSYQRYGPLEAVRLCCEKLRALLNERK